MKIFYCIRKGYKLGTDCRYIIVDFTIGSLQFMLFLSTIMVSFSYRLLHKIESFVFDREIMI